MERVQGMAEQQQSDGGGEPTRVQSRVERLCGEFAENWCSGSRPDLDSFLQRLPREEQSSGLMNLLRIEVQARRERGEEASEQEYRQRYPAASDAISIAFSTRGQSGENTRAEVEWSVATPAQETFVPTQIDPDQMDPVQGQPGQRRLPVEDPSPWQAGVMLGCYRLEEFLGRGGFGEVWKGWDTLLHRPVAIKLLRPKHLNSPYQSSFFAEGQKLEVLRRQGAAVLEVLSADVIAGWPYLVTRFLPGGTLERRIRERPRDWREACRVVAELAETLGLTHAQQIYHRDIKPANVLLDEQGQVYLADFGLATSEEQQVREGPTTGGTWCYKAPEQGETAAGITGGRTDIYALGVVLYEWLTGRRPGLENSVLHEKWLAQPESRAQPPRELNGEIPDEVQAVCLSMLDKDVTKRNITAGDVARRLRGVLEPPQPIGQARPVIKSALPVWLLAVAGSLLLVLLVGVLTLPSIVRSNAPHAVPDDFAGRSIRVGLASLDSPPSVEQPAVEELAPGRMLIAEGSAAHRRKWQGGRAVPPGLLRFRNRREEQRSFLIPDGEWLLLKSDYPQFIPFALTAERNLRRVTWRMRADRFDGWGFFYNWRELPSGKVEFGGLLFHMTHPENEVPKIWAHQTLFGVDELQAMVSPIRPFWQQEMFHETPPPQDFEISLRFVAGELTTLEINGIAVNIAMNPADFAAIGSVRAPFGFVLQKSAVELTSPQLEFEQ